MYSQCEFTHPPPWQPDITVTKVDGQGNPQVSCDWRRAGQHSIQYQALLLGEWFKYNLCVDFPTLAQDRNLVLEMFTNNPDNGDEKTLD